MATRRGRGEERQPWLRAARGERSTTDEWLRDQADSHVPWPSSFALTYGRQSTAEAFGALGRGAPSQYMANAS